MATNQMEEMTILKARDKALGAIIERYPFSKSSSPRARLGSDWAELIESLNDLAHYALAVPGYGYHWVNKTYRRDWFLSRKN